MASRPRPRATGDALLSTGRAPHLCTGLDREVSADDGPAVPPRDHPRHPQLSRRGLRVRPELRPSPRPHAVRPLLHRRECHCVRRRRGECERRPRLRVPRGDTPGHARFASRARQGPASLLLRRAAPRQHDVHVRALPLPPGDPDHALRGWRRPCATSNGRPWDVARS